MEEAHLNFHTHTHTQARRKNSNFYTFQNWSSSFEFSHTHKFDKKFKSTFIFEHNLKLCTFNWEIRIKRVELWAIYA